MKITYSLYTNIIQYGVLVLILLSGFAFFPGYLAIEKKSLPWVIHLHAFLMIIWMLMLIAQAYLIRTNHHRLHRIIGKASYVLVPALLLLTVMLLPVSYSRNVASFIERGMAMEQAVSRARAFLAIPFFYLIGFVLFYTLAILNKRKPLVHGQYMVATALMLTGPIFDRILYIYGLPAGLSSSFLWESVAFLVMDFIFAAMLIMAGRKHLTMRPAIVSLSYFIIGQLLFIFGRKSAAWSNLMALLFE